jgi:hypothetical protein
VFFRVVRGSAPAPDRSWPGVGGIVSGQLSVVSCKDDCQNSLIADRTRFRDRFGDRAGV